MAFALAYSARPAADLPPMATNPERPSALRAALHASIQALNFPSSKYRLRALADCRLDTELPSEFRTFPSFVRPPTVFSFAPRNTALFASLPLAILVTLLAFPPFIAFIA